MTCVRQESNGSVKGLCKILTKLSGSGTWLLTSTMSSRLLTICWLKLIVFSSVPCYACYATIFEFWTSLRSWFTQICRSWLVLHQKSTISLFLHIVMEKGNPKSVGRSNLASLLRAAVILKVSTLTTSEHFSSWSTYEPGFFKIYRELYVPALPICSTKNLSGYWVALISFECLVVLRSQPETLYVLYCKVSLM